LLYSEGFNPRPKLSLPLPKSVGIEVDNDLLCLQMQINTTEQDVYKKLKTQLSGQLPEGFELLAARTAKPKVPVQPCQAMYLLALKKEYLNEKLKSRIENLLANKNLNIQRQTDSENPRYKNIDVRPYLKSIELNDAGITVECKISTAGTIRVEEILELLELDHSILMAPIRRTSVQWLINES
jgi:radical SAM-linked protein